MILIVYHFISLFACLVLGASYFKLLETQVHDNEAEIPEKANNQRLCIFDFTPQAPGAVTAVQRLITQKGSPTMMLVKSFSRSHDDLLLDFIGNLASGYAHVKFFPVATGHHVIISKYIIQSASTGSLTNNQPSSCELSLQIDNTPFHLASVSMRSETVYFEAIDSEVLSGLADSTLILDFVNETEDGVTEDVPRKVYVSPSCTAESVHILSLPALTMAIIDFDL